MMEIIHDVAPGASQAFHTAVEGQASFAQGIIDLANAGASVITDDVLFFAEPMFQDGMIAQAVNIVKGMGVAYFSAAGNQNRRAYESAFRFSGVFFNIGFGPEEGHDFDPGPGIDVCQSITIPVNGTLTMVYQWDQPFFSVSGPPGSASDMDIFLTNAACDTVLAGSATPNVGGDPVVVFPFTNSGPATSFGIIIGRFAGPNPGLMKFVGNGAVTINEFDTKTGTSWGHSAALGGLGVGAARYQDTPAFGVNPPLIEAFSSAGGTPILFDTAGNRLATPEVRQQPDITAPDGGDTTFFIPGVDPDVTGFPNFFGTSAAAPHAAGVAALMKALVPSLTPDSTYAVLKTTAIDMDDPSTGGFDTGFDFGTGLGLIQADAAINEVAPSPVPLPPHP
jgi:subtilisin family serine protease